MESRSKKIGLSEHFTLEELTYSRTAVENAIANEPPTQARASLQHLANCLLEPLRQLYKKPIAILSGYRNKEVNRLVGGVATSQHVKGEAADCYTPEGPEKLLELLMRSGLPFDQAILYKRRRFLHLSLKQSGRNRMQVLVYMVCVICLFTGCGIRKRISYRSYRCNDSIQVNQEDNMALLDHFIQHDSLVLEIQQMEFMSPDSFGKQPLQRVTITCLKQISDTSDTLSIQSSVLQQSYYSKEEQLIQKQEELPPVNYKKWIFLGGICSFILGYLVFRKRRLSSFC